MQEPTRTRRPGRMASAALVAVFTLQAMASSPLSPPPPPPTLPDALPALYQALGGDEWLRNDGWLDDEVHFCDWYGVRCERDHRVSAAPLKLISLDLSRNNLVGELTPKLLDLLIEANIANRLDLSGNAIRGELTRLPDRIEVVDLSDNLLHGSLPQHEPGHSTTTLEKLKLAGNDFDGSVPASWDQLELWHLDLSDNHLDAGHEHAFAAMRRTARPRGFLYLNGNRFSGELGTEIYPASLARRGDGNAGAGLDICYNDFTVASDEVRDWIAARHVGSPDFEHCLGRKRVAISPTVSGSWFSPERSGEGISLMLMANGAPLLYHFGFDSEGRQQWLFEVGHAGDEWLRLDPLRETRGRFGQGLAYEGDLPYLRATGRLRADRLERDLISVQRHYYGLASCGPWQPGPPPPGLCPPPLFEDRLDYRPLTRLAGSTCDNRSDLGFASGAWYNPERSGEGFAVEILADERALVYWFTYQPAEPGGGPGLQAWMIGQGTVRAGDVDEPSITLPPTAFVEVDLIQPVGGVYGSDFDPDAIEYIDWGHLILALDKNTGLANWESNFDDYGSGEYELIRLAQPLLADCPVLTGR